MVTPDFSSFCVLIAEDVEANFRLYKSMLKRTGIEILHADNGEDAVNLFKNKKVDLVIMDAMMPGKDGFIATKEIRNISEEVPVIMLTAYANQDSIREAVKSGCTDYLSKPVSTEVLISALKKWLIIFDD